MILNAAGVPEAPTEIVRRLQQIDPRLNLRFASGGTGASYWAFTMDWNENDPRRKYILSGDMAADAAFDMLQMLPLDCSVDDAYAYAVRAFRQVQTREDANALLDRVHAYNAEVKKAAMQPTYDRIDEVAEHYGGQMIGALTGKAPTTVRYAKGHGKTKTPPPEVG